MISQFQKDTGIWLAGARIAEDFFLKEASAFHFEAHINTSINALFNGYDHVLISFYTSDQLPRDPKHPGDPVTNTWYARVFESDDAYKNEIGDCCFTLSYDRVKKALDDLLTSWLNALQPQKIVRVTTLRCFADTSIEKNYTVSLSYLIDEVNKDSSVEQREFVVETEDKTIDLLLCKNGYWQLWSTPKSK